MFNFIRKLLNSQNSKEQITKPETSTEEITKSPCSLELEMNNDGTVNIICSWPEFTEANKKYLYNLANHYALMLDALNSGLLEKDIANTLKSYSSDNYMDILFAQNAYYKIVELNFLRKEQEKSDAPLIKPSQVFNRQG